MFNQKKRDKMTKATLLAAQQQYNVDLSNKSSNDSQEDFSSRILKARDVTLIGGPFHYNVRSGTYGDPYDEIPWKVRMGMAEAKERHGYSENPLICNYNTKVLMNNWVEDQRDRRFIKYNSRLLSDYGYHFQTETMKAFKKPVCNKQRHVLQKIASFPITAFPGHQPELNTDTLKYSSPIPLSCFLDEENAMKDCYKQMEKDWERDNYTRTSLI